MFAFNKVMLEPTGDANILNNLFSTWRKTAHGDAHHASALFADRVGLVYLALINCFLN